MEKRKIENVPLGKLTEYARNPRIHSKNQVEQIVASIRKFGWTNPIIIDEAGMIIAGHGRYQAAKVLEMETVPCVRLVGMTPEELRAYVVADNKIGLNALWDEDLLREELQDLAAQSLDLSMTGFSSEELGQLLKEAEEAKPPAEFQKVDSDIKTDYSCPKCSYAWSGRPKS